MEHWKTGPDAGRVRALLCLRALLSVLFTLCIWGMAAVMVHPGASLLLHSVFPQLETMPQVSADLGRANKQVGDITGEQDSSAYRQAVECYRQAVFLEKYLIFWNDNARLPGYLQELAGAYASTGDIQAAARTMDESAAGYQARLPETQTQYAFACYTAAIYYSVLAQPEEELARIRAACDGYAAVPQAAQGRDAARAWVWMGKSLLESGGALSAVQWLEQGTQALEQSWQDSGDSLLLALGLRYACLAWESLDRPDRAEQARQQYEQVLFLRELEPGQVDQLADYFGWRLAWDGGTSG